MTTTPKLGLTLMAANMAQKEVVFNEAILAFDALFAGTVLSASLSTPPSSPALGDTYVVGASPVDAWSGQADSVAFYYNGWQFFAPPLQLRLYNVTSGSFIRYLGPSLHWVASISEGGPIYFGIKTVTTSYTLVSWDVGYIILANFSSSGTITIPPHSSIPFAVTTAILVEQLGSGGVTIVAGSGVTLNSVGGGLVLAGQYSFARVTNTAVDVWQVELSNTGTGGTLAGLTDVNITEGSGVDGYVLYWNNTDSKFELKAPDLGADGPSLLGINTQTASYTLALTDVGKLVDMNVGSANNLTIPPNSSVAIPIGDVIIVRQRGAGATTIVAGSGVTVNALSGTLLLAGQFGIATLTKVATDTWEATLSGLATVGGATTLTALTDVTVSEGSGIDKQVLYWHNSASAWESITLSALIDTALGNTQGNVLYRGASSWSVLAPGTSGQLLTTGGASANPSWTTVSGGGGGGLYNQVLSATPTTSSTGFGTWLNQQSASVDNGATGMALTSPVYSGGVIGLLATAPSAPYTARALLTWVQLSSGYDSFSLGWYDGSNKLHTIRAQHDDDSNGGGSLRIIVDKWNSPTSYSATEYISAPTGLSVPLWMELIDDGTNVSFGISSDGVHFLTVVSDAKSASWLGSSGYNYLVFSVCPSTVTVITTMLSWSVTTP